MTAKKLPGNYSSTQKLIYKQILLAIGVLATSISGGCVQSARKRELCD